MLGVAAMLNKKLSYMCKQNSQSSSDHRVVFDRKSDGIVVIGLIPAQATDPSRMQALSWFMPYAYS